MRRSKMVQAIKNKIIDIKKQKNLNAINKEVCPCLLEELTGVKKIKSN